MTYWSCVSLLITVALVCSAYAIRLKSRPSSDFPWVTKLTILNFVLAIPMSGLVHLSTVRGVARGYYDLSLTTRIDELFTATVACGLAGMGLVLGSYWAGVSPELQGVARERLRLPGVAAAIVLGVALLTAPVALQANRRMGEYAEATEQSRIITVASGEAVHYYMATWWPWAIALAAVALLSGGLKRSPLSVAVVAGASLAMVAYVLAWTGGRTLVLVVAAPLVAVVFPLLRKIRWTFLATGAVVAGIFIWRVSQIRSGARTDFLSVWAWIDWQWGRFSMMGFAHDYSEAHGPLWGETLANALLLPVQSSADLVGWSVAPSLHPRSAGEITSYSITADASATHVVPGLAGELMLNFGFAGLFVGFLLLGWAVRKVDRRFSAAENAIAKLLWAYVGSLCIFRTVTSTLDAFVAYFIFTGSPLLAAYILTTVVIKRRAMPNAGVANEGSRKPSVTPSM